MNNIFSKDKKPEAEKKPAAEQKTAFYKRRNFKFGSVATLITVFVIAAIVIVNVLVTFLVVKYPLSVDMTTNQDYKLTADTTKYLKNMSTKIDIYIIDSESGFQNAAYPNTSTYCYKNAYEIIKQYPQYDSNIQVHYIDINTDPSFKSEYPNETLALDDVIVANGTKYKHLTSTDLFTTTTSNYGDMKVSGNTTEQAIDSGILSVTATNLPSIVLTTGHDETGYDGLKALLTSNNYTVVTQDLSLKKLDSKVAVLAIVDPRVDFTTTEISQIDAFLNNNDKYGKSLMVYFDPGQSTLPNLENYLSNYWGLKVGKGTLYDQTHAVNAIQYPIAETLDTTIFSKLSTSIVTMLPNTRPISPLYTTKSNDTTSALMQTYNSTALWVAKSKTDKLAPSASDKKAVYTAMALSSKSVSLGNSLAYSRVMVSGTTDFINSSLLQESDLNNGTAMITLTNYLGNYNPSLSIVTKDLTSATLTLTAPQITTIKVIFLFLLPVVMLVLGLIVWLRRRHL